MHRLWCSGIFHLSIGKLFTFSISSPNHFKDFNETWQEASNQGPLMFVLSARSCQGWIQGRTTQAPDGCHLSKISPEPLLESTKCIQVIVIDVFYIKISNFGKDQRFNFDVF